MSLFPRTFVSQAAEAEPTPSSYRPLFRFFDEFDQYSRAPERARQSTPTNQHNHSHAHTSPFSLFKPTPTFTPKFDVKEVKDGYELHGEFPGIDQKDIQIEFTDSNTLTIKGRTERSYTSGTPPSSKGAIEDTKSNPNSKDQDTTPDKSHADHKAKVEDEDAATSTEIINTPKNNEKEVANAKHNKPAEKEEKYWISERSVGEFERSFSFPVRVDRDAVKASMKNGVLSVVVPKAKKMESRKIVIEDASN